jgi:3-hydroxyisobutyrate dehydrogenase-like beta-hydroxyacid dehydrogenase
MKRITVLGLGLLGDAVAQRLLAGGFEVTGYDVRPEAIENLAGKGLKAASSVAKAVADADLVFTVLPSLKIVDDVIRGAEGVLANARPDTTIAQMSTISPSLTRSLGESAGARGIRFLDTPMSGTRSMVLTGDCTIFVGGERAHADACRAVFAAIGRQTIHVGPVGSAMLAKLATNLLVGVNTVAVAEALVLGAKGGLDPAHLLEVLRQSAATSRMLEVRGPLMVKHDFTAQMKIDLFMKDFDLMLEEGKRVGAPLLLTGLSRELSGAAAALGHGADDLAAVIAALETMAGLGDR